MDQVDQIEKKEATLLPEETQMALAAFGKWKENLIHWIPIKKELPPAAGQYVVTVLDHKTQRRYSTTLWWDKTKWTLEEVIAWSPFPQLPFPPPYNENIEKIYE